MQPDWVWIPAHYVWAPRGYVFVDGYWDYSIGRRGVLFAPVYFSAGVYGRPGFSYSPTTVIDLGVFANHLFLRPRYQHYYFGDYYAANYGSAGFYPSYAVNSGRFGYDPIYAHNRWQHRQDRGWDQRVAADFKNRRDHEDLRPPRTWAAQRAMDARAVQAGARNLRVATPLTTSARNRNSPRCDSRPVNQAERQRLAQQAQDVQRFRQERQKLDNQPRRGGPARAKTSRLSDRGEVRRRTRQGTRSAEDIRDSEAGSQRRGHAASESIAGAAEATHGEPGAARPAANAASTAAQGQAGPAAATPGQTAGSAPQPKAVRQAPPAQGRSASAAAQGRTTSTAAKGRATGAAAEGRAKGPAAATQGAGWRAIRRTKTGSTQGQRQEIDVAPWGFALVPTACVGTRAYLNRIQWRIRHVSICLDVDVGRVARAPRMRAETR